MLDRDWEDTLRNVCSGSNLYCVFQEAPTFPL